MKTWRNRKIHEREALLRRRHQQWIEGHPEEESPSKTVSGEESDDSSDNDARSRYDTATFLSHLHDVGPCRDPSVGG
jgi:hypothetical protein